MGVLLALKLFANGSKECALANYLVSRHTRQPTLSPEALEKGHRRSVRRCGRSF
jgi:hypothetical protein